MSAEEAADASVWSIVCFYIPRTKRRRGVGRALLTGAVAHARARGARILEAYPVDTRGRRIPSANAFTGTLDLFAAAGFGRVSERVAGRPLVQLPLA